MKHLSALLLVLGTNITAYAQLLQNPSFENVVGGDLSYWQHQCIAQSAAEGAPSSGNWCAEVEASNPQGCLGANLYQVVPGAYSGMPFFLGGWCRNTPGLWMPTIGFDIGIMDQGGTITLMGLGLSTTGPDWTWLSTEDTLELGVDEQAVVVCNPGLVGGPGFALSRFDGLQFFESFPESIEEGPALNSLCDITGGWFMVSCSNAAITRADLVDLTGRSVHANGSITNANTVRVPLALLPPGIYLVAVHTDRGQAAVRFAVDR